jgi:hypothetical protein
LSTVAVAQGNLTVTISEQPLSDLFSLLFGGEGKEDEIAHGELLTLWGRAEGIVCCGLSAVARAR